MGGTRQSLREIVTSAPTNAWLLMGDEASMPTPEELARSRTAWREMCLWTGPKQVQPGDLLFFYFVAPTKAIQFIARAATYPIFDPHEGVNSDKPVDPNQWWLTHTPFVPVAPVRLSVMTGCPNLSLSLTPIRRATKSVPPPGATPTSKRKGLVG